MFSYIKRHWPVYLILALIAIALGFGAAYIVGVKGSTPESTISEEVEHEQSLGADWQRSLIIVLTCARIVASECPGAWRRAPVC